MKRLYERLLNMTKDGVYRYRADDGVLLLINRGALQILDLDLSPSQAVGKNIGDLIQYTEKTGMHRKQLIDKGSIRGLEYHFKTLKGEDRWVLHDAFLVTDPDTGLQTVEAIIKDITAIREASRKVDDERNRLAVTLRSIGDGLAATDEQGRVTLLNPVAERLTGWTQDQAAGLPADKIFKFINEYTRLDCENPITKVLQTGQTVALANHTILIARDGTERSIADSAAPIRNAEGMIMGAVLVFRDVTGEKLILNALRTSEENYRQLFKGMLSAFALHEIICDSEGKPVDYRFLEINSRFEEMTGLRGENLIGRTVKEVLPETDEEWIATYGNVALTGKSRHFERYSSALNRYYEVTAYQPAPGRFATLFIDITAKRKADEERLRMETHLQQVQKLESLGILAGGIAHDFNNLLTGILGNASLALLDIPEGARAHHSLMQIELSAQRAAELCQQLLAYSGKGRFVVEPISLSGLVEEMGNMLRVSISKKTILTYSLAPALPAILGDATQFRQVIMNLIVNASEAIGDREGTIFISTGVRQCDRDYLRDMVAHSDIPEGHYVFVSISDTGSGIEAAILPRIFDPFFSTKFTGRGLGLAAVLGIVRSHHGSIRVHSEVGSGSEFTVLFPALAETAGGGTVTPPIQPKAAFTGTILAVDDDEIVLSIAGRALEKMGARVLTAKNGFEAVELFKGNWKEISLVLLDMTMPRMNGEETFRELRRIDPNCVVILSSGYNEQEAINRFSEKGLAGFLQKPYRLEDLAAKIAAVLPH